MPQTVQSPRATALPQREVHLRDLLAVLRRHWLIVVMAPALVALAAWLTSRNDVPRFQSRLTVQITSPKQVFARLDDIDVDELALRTDPILSEALVLTTQGLAREVVTALGLQVEPADPATSRAELFTGIAVDSGAPQGAYLLRLRGPAGYEVRDSAGTLVAAGPYATPATGAGLRLEIHPADVERDIPFRVVPRDAAATAVRAGLSYAVRQGTNAVDMFFTGTDRSWVPRILNEAALRLRLDGAERARAIAARKRAYVYDQLEQSREVYQTKLRELQAFKERQEIADLSAEAQATVNAIQNSEVERQRLLVQLATVEETLRDTTTLGIETLNRLSAVQISGDNAALAFQIQSLLKLYDERRAVTAGALGLQENNPEVVALDQRLRQSHEALRGAVGAAAQAIAARLRAIEAEIARLRGTLRTFPGMETRIAQLQLEVGIQEQTTRYLLGQYESTRMQEATIAPYVTVLDGASAPYRIGTTPRQKILLGVLLGLLLGLAGAFFLEYLDQTIKSPQDVDRVLRLPVLGTVPLAAKLSGGGTGRRPITVLSALDPDDPVAEAFRTLRTNVTFVAAERPVQVLAVTSPGPGEGKSTTAANLALALAQGGHRTLLVDSDLRRPLLHQAFGLVRDPGLTDILAGRVGAREAIRPDVASGLDMLPAGSTPPNPSELLASEAMHALLTELRQEYEYLVLDTPPVLPVTDAAVVATAADATILTLRSGDTEETPATRAMEQLERVAARVAGVVLNGVDSRRDRHYRYYRYQRNAGYGARSPVRTLRRRISRIF